ncbi:enoyl-CoA hydratase/carnithine racemase [Bradyrhizobium sp. F1.13.4]
MDSRIMTALGDRVLELGPKPAAYSPYKHFKLTRDADGAAWLLFDRTDASANTLSSDVMEEFDAVLAAIETERPAGLVIRSAKPSGFIAGADVNEFRGASDAGMVETRIRAAHAVVDHLEALKLPTVAVIHGFCLGGGLEVALACQSRIAIDGARFGFPEVMLGLHPGLGGTARFTALVNPTQSMALMLTGRTIDARRAKSLGLVDTVTQERHVRNAVKDALFGRLKRVRPGMLTRAANFGPVRGLLARRMRSEAAKAASREHYPAPYALIDLWETHDGRKAAMLKAEQASFAKLMVTPTAQNLIRVFFLREQMKKAAGSGNTIKHVHVIGAGAMGGDIAAWCAGQGLRVSLADMKAEPIAGAVKRAAELYGKIIRKPTEVRDALDRLIPDVTGEGARNADLIIEAVPEKLELKQKVYAALEPRMKPGAILATNTSSIPLQDLRTTLARPERLVGLHFFNPVSRLQLVEVVSHDGNDAQVLKQALAFRRRDRSAAFIGEELAGLLSQPRADALHAGSDGDAGREDRPAPDRRCRGAVRHADGADRTGRPGRARHLSRCRRHAAHQVRRSAAADPGLAAREGCEGRTRPQDRQGLLRLARRQGREGAVTRDRSARHRPDDRPPGAADVQRLRCGASRGYRR